MKDFKFITEEEFAACHTNNHSLSAKVEAVNHFLNKKAQKGFTRVSEGTVLPYICNTVRGFDPNSDTHYVWIFLREFEEEKPKCDHRQTKPIAGHVQNIIEIIIDFKRDGWIECPKCGEKLK